MIEDAPFFELSLTDSDGRQITPQRFRTVQDAMTVAEDHRGVAGAILFYAGDDSEPVEVIVYSADGSIAVGDGVPDDDEEWEDDPWTDRRSNTTSALPRRSNSAGRWAYPPAPRIWRRIPRRPVLSCTPGSRLSERRGQMG